MSALAALLWATLILVNIIRLQQYWSGYFSAAFPIPIRHGYATQYVIRHWPLGSLSLANKVIRYCHRHRYWIVNSFKKNGWRMKVFNSFNMVIPVRATSCSLLFSARLSLHFRIPSVWIIVISPIDNCCITFSHWYHWNSCPPQYCQDIE